MWDVVAQTAGETITGIGETIMDKSHTFRVANKEQLRDVFQKCASTIDAGKPLSIKISLYRKRRSIDQNARYWALLTEISQGMPDHMDGEYFAPEMWHEYFKRKFLGVEVGPYGEPVPKSTAKLSTVDMAEYQEQIEAWAAGEGLEVMDEDQTG